MRLVKGYYPAPVATPPERGVSDVDYASVQSNGVQAPIPAVKSGTPDPKHAQINRVVQLYNTNLDVFRACDLFSNWFAGLPLTVVRKKRDDEEVLDPQLDYPLNFLEKGNYRESGYLLKKKLAIWFLLARCAYLAFRIDPNGAGLQFEVLDPRKVLRVPGKDRQIETYVYYDASLPDAEPVFYDASCVIELAVDGFGAEPYAITTPPTEVFADAAISRNSRDSLASRTKQQGGQMGVVYTDVTNANAMRDRLSKDSRRGPYMFLDVNEKFEPINLVNKDGIEADLLARAEATKSLYSAMKTPTAIKDIDPSLADKVREVIAIWLRSDVIPLGQLFTAQLTSKMCVGRVRNRSVRVQQSNILELAPLYVEAVRATVARLNSSESTVDEERESAGMDRIKLPEEVAEFTWATGTPKAIVDLYKAKQMQINKPGPEGSGTGASTSMPLPGSQGGREQRTEGNMIDETAKK